MSYLDLLPDDVILSILELNCDDIEAEIYRINVAIDWYNDTIKELEIFTDEDYDSDYNDDEDYEAQLEIIRNDYAVADPYDEDVINQYYQDEIYLNNLSSNI